jgi:subtilisin-like proprotein convertase family protein
VGYTITNSCTTYDFTTPFTLNDGATSFTVKTINIPTSGLVSDVNVHVNATTANLHDLNIAIIAPGLALQNLFNQQCTGSANMDVTFDSQAAPFACGNPLTGTMALPTGSLDGINNHSQLGNWQFGFRDLVGGATPTTINSFSLEVCTQVITLAAENFDFENFALYPNPSNGNFSVQFNSASGNKISIAVYDMRGRKIFGKSYNNSGLFSQKIQLENAQAGVYLVSIADGDKKIVKRIVIQ